MRHKEHHYRLKLQWTGNTGKGTSDYRAYQRSHDLKAEGKATIHGSSDATFRGDRSLWNPEELLVSALSSCHMLAYLHLCAVAGIVVVDYTDSPEGVMQETDDDGGHFVRVLLKPSVTITSVNDIERAKELHHNAHEKCFIANSVNFPVDCEPTIKPQ